MSWTITVTLQSCSGLFFDVLQMSWTITSITILLQTIFGCVVDVLDHYCHNTILFQTICGCPCRCPGPLPPSHNLVWTISGHAVDVLDIAAMLSCSRPFVDVGWMS